MRSDTEFPDTRGSLLLQLQTREHSQAWLQFVDVYRPIIYRMARKRGLQDADAQDLSQTVLISIANSIDRWEKRDESIRFRNWLRKVAKNAITNALTRAPRDRASGGTEVIDLLREAPEPNKELERELVLEHRRELFSKAANIVKSEVSAETWQIFQLAVIDGMPIEKVAARINKSVGAAYACRGRVMNRLRRAVSEMENHEQSHEQKNEQQHEQPSENQS